MKKLILTLCGFCLMFAFQATAPAQTITSQPQSITVNNASTATFTVGADNASSYQWQFGGSNIDGATNSVLTLEDVNTNQAGSYTVIINNAVRSSPPAVLTIVPGTIVQFTFSGFPDGSASNVNVQLFDHDKPATVENFIHYIKAGGYTNMFFDRCAPGFVLQGGDCGATDRTNTSSPITGWFIANTFTDGGNQPTPPYPPQLDSEFGIGPIIHNRFGTMAMALGANLNSANSAFFFNLVDNSGSLDDGDFTVFGRILDANGTNVLQYFNSVSPGEGAVAGEVFSDNGTLYTNAFANLLPVNYDGTNLPANSNLVFCDFTFVTTPPVDTNPPTVAITYPAANVVLTSGNPVVQGTASDDVGLAVVICELIPQAAADGTYPNGGVSITNYADGTTNWSVIFTNTDDFDGLVPPGSYSLSVQSQDGAGNLSPAMVQPLTITAVVANGNGTVTFTNGVFTNLNPVGYPFQNGSNYNLLATPATNQLFVSWTVGNQIVFTPEVPFTMSDGLLLTASFTISQPQSITVNNASTATFVVATSNALSYQWQFDGTNIDGATNSVLTLEDVNTNQAGSYTVVIDNSVTSSPPALLTIVPGTIVQFTFSGFPDGGTSNVSVQLFDHDKPATVENFIHYIRAGGYTNMFFDRCAPGFVLQGGDYDATDRTNTSPPLTVWNIAHTFTDGTNQPTPPYPPQVDNEYSVGPLIHNRAGTIAMALTSGESNSADSAFFFNIADNSGSLDFQDFTVFGRILDATGTNVLQYFNTLSPGNDAVTNEVFLYEGALYTNLFLNLLPVNYDGTSLPDNANLIFCDFQLPTNAPVDTNPPAVLITSPAADALLTNGNPTVEGMANDDVGLAVVICVLTPQAAADGTYPNGGFSITNYAIGTTNWAVNFMNPDDVSYKLVPPGGYNLSVQAQDGAGNLSPAASQPLTNSTFFINGNGTVTFTTNGFTNLNAVGYPFLPGSNYSVLAIAGSNQVFLNWTYLGNVVEVNPEFLFPMSDGLELIATFITNGIPNSIAFTYPPPGVIIGTNTFNITGTISNAPSTPLTVTCYIYSRTTYELAAISPLTTSGTTNWSVTVSNLPPDLYSVEAVASDTNGNRTAISEDFAVAMNDPLQLDIAGPGTVSGATNGEFLLVGTIFEVTATPNPGQFFFSWNNGSQISLNPVQTNTMADELTLTATFVANTMPNTIAFTSPPASVVLSNGSVLVAGTISNAPSPPVTVTCLVFSQTNLLAVTPPLTTTGTTTWSVIASGLTAGSYIAEVEAVDQAGNSTVITANFTAIVDTNPPVVSILSPATNAVLIDSSPIMVNGTARDSLGVAGLTGYLIPMSNADGAIPNGGLDLFDNAVGTTNWSVDFGIVPPGAYTLDVLALDNAGNVGQQIQSLTNTAILINGTGSVSLTQGSNALANPVGYPLQYGTDYKLVATPGTGQAFVGWSEGAYTTTNPVVDFTMSAGILWTATFVPSNSGKGISFTYPTANARLATNTFLLRGRMTSSFKSARVSCQIFSLTTSFGVGPLLATSGTTTWSAGVSNLPPDNYVVVAMATNAAGLSTTISEKFSILAFVEAAGTYTGLFISTNSPVSATNSGFLTFTVGPSGTFSGRLVFPAYPPIPIYSLAFENIDFTTGFVPFGFSDFHGPPLIGSIYLDLSGGTGLAYGTIASDTWSAQLICHRAVTKLSTHTTPATGKYILSLQPGSQTNGYASLTVASGGAMTVSGALPDNTTFSQSARVSKDGIWPLYAVPAGGDGKGGMLIGWETNSVSGSCSGQLFWYKAPNIGAYYQAGVGVVSNMLLSSTGTNYLRPVTGSQYSIIFQGGTILPPLTNTLMVNAAGQFVVSGSPADKLKISVSANGVLTGTILNPNDNKTLRFKGAFLGPSQGGSGFIPDADGQTGCFKLKTASP